MPALHRALLKAGMWKPRDVNADIGGGKYDLATEVMRQVKVVNLVYDPFNRPDDHNSTVFPLIDQAMTATVANVLNVIAEPEVRAEVIRLAAKAPKAFFTVYEGDRSGVGKKTRDGWQESRPLATYLPEVQAFMEARIQTVGGLRMIVGDRRWSGVE